MPSWQGQLLNFIMRNRHFLGGSLKKDSWDFNTSIPQFREKCEKMNSMLAKLPAGIEVEPLNIDGLYAEWILPSKGTKDKVILYTIGGGYVSGSCNDHRSIVAKLVQESGVSTLLFEHRLAPEHPFPAALDDSITAYKWLLNQGIKPIDIMIIGESAGGGLCLATLLALRDQGYPLPAAAVALSPWTDLLLTGESHHTKAKVCLSPLGMAAVCTKYYVGDNDPANPWISPLYGDLHGLPPIAIYVGEDETLLDDSLRFAEKAQAAGVNVTLKVGQRMVHCYPFLPAFIPEARIALKEICQFIKTHLGK